MGLLPSWFLYHVLADIIYFFVYRVARYRLKVVRTNLANSFPEKDLDWLRSVERRYYRHLSELFIDTIDLSSISRRGLRRRMTFVGLDEHLRRTEGQDWIAALSHYGSWEYFGAYAMNCPGECIGVYSPLHSRVFDRFYRDVRTRFGLVPVTRNTLLRHVLRTRAAGGPKMSIGMIADQSPPFFEINHWYRFLNQPTPFFWGIEKMAVRFNMPVYFMQVRKTGRARYEGEFKMIYDGREPVAEFEITQRYADALEALILRQPELWMWSHRRWKHTPQTVVPTLRTRPAEQ